MRVLIADDEAIARQVLREHLEEIPGVTIAGEAATGSEAAGQIARLRPDLVLMDLNMPEIDGFSVARGLAGAAAPAVVFVTAHESRAIDAFQIGAVDYLLKPVRRERLAEALDRVRARLAASPPPAPAPEAGLLRRVAGRSGGDYHIVDLKDVVAFQAHGDEVRILGAEGWYLANQTLKALEERLPSPQFRRIRRDTIVNTHHIRKISPLSSKRWLLKMSNGLEAVVSKRLAGAIRDETGW